MFLYFAITLFLFTFIVGVNKPFSIENVSLIEGDPLTFQYTANTQDSSQRFTVPNRGVDHSTVTVSIKENSFTTTLSPYTLATDLLEVSSTSNVFFIEEGSDFKTEIKKTKILNEFLIKNKLINSLIISDKNSKINIIKSARNIPNLKIIDPDGANVYDLMKYKNVIFTLTSIKSLQERLSK